MASMKFSSISTTGDLIDYLKESQRLNNVKHLHKYMKLSSVISMFTSNMLLINNPANMNDLYEYKAFENKANWSKICFASFITQSTESMAMWSMYAQPWTEGVMISVPTSSFRKLIHDTRALTFAEYNEKTNWYTPGDTEISSDGLISIARVAYLGKAVLTCTGRDDRNHNFSNAYEMPELAGYIKDSAWDYEKEVRLRVDLPVSYSSNAVFLPITDEFLNSITITTGPRFAENVLIALPAKYRPNIQIETSKFNEKIAWIPCDSCSRKKPC